MRRSLLVSSLLLLSSATGCSGSLPVDNEDHDFLDPRDVDLGADPWRARSRMDIDQLDSSIRVATGGIGWDRGGVDSRTSEFAYYADTLGVPDYINSSTEDRSVSLLFVKFLGDASRAVCRRLADREGGSPSQYDGDAQGIFAPVDVNAAEPEQADIDAALSSLLLRFHGRDVPVGADELQLWRELHARMAASEAALETPRRAWEGVCVALLTHSDFYTY